VPLATVGIETPGIGARWSAVRRFAGYGAAATLSLYLLVKVVWVIGTLLGDGPKNNHMGTADFVALNTVTVGMSVIGVALGLALAQPWGQRIPAWPLTFVAWVGAGFLVPLLPYMVVSAVLGAAGVGTSGADDGKSGGGAMPAWEGIFISIGIAGMAVGLVVALPIYMRERYPSAFLGRLGDRPTAVGSVRSPWSGVAVRAAVVMSSGLGLLWLYWAIGGTLGMDPAHHDLLVLNARLLTGSWGAWALIGAWSIWVITTRRQAARLRLWIPTSLAFVASGSLFAWSSWKLPVAVWRPGDYVTPEYPVVAVIQHVLSISAGIAIIIGLQRAHRAVRDYPEGG
jgi:hypothetical protein